MTTHNERLYGSKREWRKVGAALNEREARMTGSVECPHCHLGFAPSVIEQHVREKHGIKPYMWRGTLNGV
jgi:hypothetical protein